MAVGVRWPGWVSRGCSSAELSQAKWKFTTGKSGGSGDGVRGGGDVHAAAPLVPGRHRTAARWAGPSRALSPSLVLELPESLRPCSPESPWTAACACGRGLWTDEGGSGWLAPEEEGHLGFSSPCRSSVREVCGYGS